MRPRRHGSVCTGPSAARRPVTMPRAFAAIIACLLSGVLGLCGAVCAQVTPSLDEDGVPINKAARRGDLRRVDWIRPFDRALTRARRMKRVLIVKPILGGSNEPDPNGLPCGGVRDCEGSW